MFIIYFPAETVVRKEALANKFLFVEKTTYSVCYSKIIQMQLTNMILIYIE